MNSLPLEYQFIITALACLLFGAFLGAAGVRKLSAGWKCAAKYWRYEATRRGEYNWRLAEDVFESNRYNEKLEGQLAVWKDYYNQSLRSEIKLRQQLLANRIEPDA